MLTNGRIETLIEEAYNERMHLLTFLQLRKPGWFMRVCILGAQGVFFNACKHPPCDEPSR